MPLEKDRFQEIINSAPFLSHSPHTTTGPTSNQFETWTKIYKVSNDQMTCLFLQWLISSEKEEKFQKIIDWFNWHFLGLKAMKTKKLFTSSISNFNDFKDQEKQEVRKEKKVIPAQQIRKTCSTWKNVKIPLQFWMGNKTNTWTLS